jgi:hypothetical protein
MSFESSREPSLKTVLDMFENSLMNKINCVAIGKVYDVDYSSQSLSADIVYKRLLEDGTVKSYPQLIHVPYLVLQGGKTFIGMPVEKGDYCIVLFCDKDFSRWFESGAENVPDSVRRHSLSNGIAIAGINPKAAAFDYDGSELKIFTDKKVNIKGSEIKLNGDSKSFVTYAELNTALSSFMSALNTHIHTSAAAGSPTTPPVSPMLLDIGAAETQTVKTGG